MATPDSDLNTELVLGLVAAVGTETPLVLDLLKERIRLAGYETNIVKISKDVIPTLVEVPDESVGTYERISGLMDCGNKTRTIAGDNSILAHGAAADIYTKRDGLLNPKSKTIFIIDSLKRPEEIETLRQIYPGGFLLLGIHAEENRRLQHLRDNLGMSKTHALDLIERDGEERKQPHGQRVNNAFYLADFFVRVTENIANLRGDLQRMVELWFGNPFITPTFEEHAMFMAFSSALRSADLSRQVGAVVTRNEQILSSGANDCPKSGGGLYWPARSKETGNIQDTLGGRDYTREDGDSNKAEQNRIIERILDLGTSKFRLDRAILEELLRASPIADITEYGRVVHAEMEALLSCARNGLSTVGTTLFCTTFPCHNCAKHIVAAGVSKVLYIEPYPKSKALSFHEDSIAQSSSATENDERRVIFEPFVGIGPRKFFDLFSMHLGSSYTLKRKDGHTGKPEKWTIPEANLRIQLSPASYLELEATSFKKFAELKREKFND